MNRKAIACKESSNQWYSIAATCLFSNYNKYAIFFFGDSPKVDGMKYNYLLKT